MHEKNCLYPLDTPDLAVVEFDGGQDGTGCQCIRKTYDCGCCVQLDIPLIHLDDTGQKNKCYNLLITVVYMYVIKTAINIAVK